MGSFALRPEENDQSLSYIDLTNEVNVPSKKSFVISLLFYVYSS